MKASKFFLAAMMVAAVAMVGCKNNETPDDPIVDPVNPGGETSALPDYSASSSDVILIAAKINAPVCGKVVFEGGFQGWDLGTAVEFVADANNEGWYTLEIPASDEETIGTCKALASDADGNVPSDWSSQWLSDKVTILQGDATMVDDPGQKAMKFQAAGGDVVYIQIDEWQVNPCAALVPAGTGKFTITFAEDAYLVDGAEFIFTGNFEEKSWGDSDRTMTKEGNAYTWEGAYPEGFQYKVIQVANGTQIWAEGNNAIFDGVTFTHEFTFVAPAE